MKAYKLFRVRKDNSLGPLFINRKQRISLHTILEAEDHPTPGYAHRPGWHCCTSPSAPHLSSRNRRWFEVRITNYKEIQRPIHQGGTWYLAKQMEVIRPYES